ncbi:hypothetical protein BXZ70DRAFT_748863 [Cristinia sonorae]|uniref:Uncharacterized protein n=1 Tax=Cristinia sonorae TaxID=1940300 RepID=A0A8K0UCH0_9AGAR|nr:hypothetical protein BXZ70DRAFT_748863 [Cristinia sonorae]
MLLAIFLISHWGKRGRRAQHAVRYASSPSIDPTRSKIGKATIESNNMPKTSRGVRSARLIRRRRDSTAFIIVWCRCPCFLVAPGLIVTISGVAVGKLRVVDCDSCCSCSRGFYMHWARGRFKSVALLENAESCMQCVQLAFLCWSCYKHSLQLLVTQVQVF